MCTSENKKGERDLSLGPWVISIICGYFNFMICCCCCCFPDGRSKSKIMVDNHCKLLLIREETGSPSRQLSQWADVLLLVFSYADIDSLNQAS